MDVDVLLSRVRELQQQFVNNKQTINVLSEQLEEAKANFHMTNGRIQELSLLIDLEKKLLAQAADEAAKKLADEQKKLEGCDGKVIQQDPE